MTPKTIESTEKPTNGAQMERRRVDFELEQLVKICIALAEPSLIKHPGTTHGNSEDALKC